MNATDKGLLIANEAREWIGTPWRHNQRVKGIGVDCVGLAMAVAEVAGVYLDYGNYERRPRQDSLYQTLLSCPELSPKEWVCDREPGDLLLLRVGRSLCHVGIVTTNDTYVHASQTAGKVVEAYLSQNVLKYVHAVFHVK